MLRRLWSCGRVRATLLVLCTAAVYAPSVVGGEFLTYDDDWLIVENPVLDMPLSDALPRILADFSSETRLALGAEYLPVRDLSVWVDVAVFGRSAPAMRAVQVLLYLAAVLAFRAAFLVTFGSVRGEMLAWAFALHPLHLESVAWLAGRKDVLALLFMGLCLWRHAVGRRDALISVPLLWGLACLSKSMSIGLLGPLLAVDLFRVRSVDGSARVIPALARLGLGLVVVAGTLLAHVHVGRVVHMVSGPLSGSRENAVWTMGEVWLRYLGMIIDPATHSVRHDLVVRTEPTWQSGVGWALLLGSGALAAWRLRRGEALPAAAWLWFAVPLIPVSQILFPLQNVLADRYLWLSVCGPLILLCHLDRLVPSRAALAASVAVIAFWGTSTLMRAPRFANSETLFREATARTQHDPIAPHHVGLAFSARQRPELAQPWFELALRRCGPDDALYPKIVHSIVRSHALQARLPLALRLAEEGLRSHPNDRTLTRDRDKLRAAIARQIEEQDGARAVP